MDDDDNQARNSFLTLYVQKQEQLLLDYLRKSIEAEIKVVALTSSIQDISSQYEESQKQVELQNDMMQQAAKGLEITTLEKKHLEEKEKELTNRITELTNNYETRIKDIQNSYETRVKDTQTSYETRIRELETVYGQTREELQKIKESTSNFEKQYNDIKREYEIQKQELNNTYKENQELKSKIPVETKAVKKQVKKQELLLDSNEF